MPTNTKLGILVPGGFGGTPPTLAEYSAFFRRAEELGYDSLWVIDRIFHPNSIIDPMTLLACAATVTERVRLGTSVLLFVLRHPVLVAKTTATLDYLSGGRLTLGISLGGRDNEFGPLGVDVRRRVSRFNEGLEVMRRLWSERDVTHHGRYFHMDNVNIDPKPVQQPSHPHHHRRLRRHRPATRRRAYRRLGGRGRGQPRGLRPGLGQNPRLRRRRRQRPGRAGLLQAHIHLRGRRPRPGQAGP